MSPHLTNWETAGSYQLSWHDDSWETIPSHDLNGDKDDILLTHRSCHHVWQDQNPKILTWQNLTRTKILISWFGSKTQPVFNDICLSSIPTLELEHKATWIKLIFIRTLQIKAPRPWQMTLWFLPFGHSAQNWSVCIIKSSISSYDIVVSKLSIQSQRK